MTSSSKRTATKSNTPTGYQLAGAAKELHGGIIYCSAWSNDLHKYTIQNHLSSSSSNNNGALWKETEPINNNDCSNEEKKSANLDVSSNTKTTSDKSDRISECCVVMVRYMATCGGNHVTIYEVEVSRMNNIVTDTNNDPSTDKSPKENNGQTSTTNTTLPHDASVVEPSVLATGDTSSSVPLLKRTGLKVRQTYCDTDDEEVFYTCAFGGMGSNNNPHYSKQPFGSDSVETKSSSSSSDQNQETIVLPATIEDKDATATAKAGTKRKRPTQLPTNDDGNTSASSKYDRPQLLCVAGKRGIIKIIDTTQQSLHSILTGHGDEIYDLKFSPINPWLLLSASKDESLRLWNVKTATCIAIFSGHEGHRESAVCSAWHPLGNAIVSSGMDSTVKVWTLARADMQKVIKESFSVTAKSRNVMNKSRNASMNGERDESKKNFRTLLQQLPTFSSNKMHTDYVDCVQFVGDLILSKSTSNKISLWKPGLGSCTEITSLGSNTNMNDNANTNGLSSTSSNHQRRVQDNVTPLRDFELISCDIWFLRFSTDSNCNMLAIGNCKGDIRIWEIGGEGTRKQCILLSNPACTSTIRMVTFSPDGKFLIATCDDGTIWKWNAKFS